MKVLLIGGTGLLSAPVASLLYERGCDLTLFHRGTTKSPLPVREIFGDRSNAVNFSGLLHGEGPWDCVMDMIGSSRQDAVSLIEVCRDKTPQIIFCSTTTVYQRPYPCAFPKEEDLTLEPPSEYGRNKLAFEQALQAAAESGTFSVTVIRPGHLYGSSSKPLHSLGNRTSHLSRMQAGRPIVIHDDGEGLWSALWVEDAAAAIAAAAGKPRVFNRIYHLAGERHFTWNTWHRLLGEMLGEAPAAVYVPVPAMAVDAPERSAQMMRTLRYPGVYDCSAAKRDLGFRCAMDLREGLGLNIRELLQENRIEPWEADAEYESLAQRWGAEYGVN